MAFPHTWSQCEVGEDWGREDSYQHLQLELCCFIKQELLPDLFCDHYSMHISEFNEVEDSP